ncbi:hypothetical protein FBR05_00940 [Deltaproteobacteria bacterium PRO3]|nr:hypothetical protein [Deltaproteobacteria bacterium PRO3]
MEIESDSQYKNILPGMRGLLYLACLLTFIAGIQLFVLTEQTDRYFAWTIAVPLTAAFLGANYLASALLTFLSARKQTWAQARATLPSVLVFTTLLLVATLLHYDKFHWRSVFGWAWLLVYVAVPPLLLYLLIRQWRSPGEIGPRLRPMPFWLRGVLFLEGLYLLGLGAWMFWEPAQAAPYWPWKLTPLTARAVASWLCGIGISALQVPLENDFDRIGPPLLTFTAIGVLQVVALIRFPGDFIWSSLSGVYYLLFLANILFLGSYSLHLSRRV